MKMPRDGARAPSFSKKASAKQSTIKCVRHPGRTRRATNWNHNSRETATVIPAVRAFDIYGDGVVRSPRRRTIRTTWLLTGPHQRSRFVAVETKQNQTRQKEK